MDADDTVVASADPFVAAPPDEPEFLERLHLDEREAQQFLTRSTDAVPVIIRSAESYLLHWSGLKAYTGQAIQAVGVRKGRRAITFSVPTTYTDSGGTTHTPPGVMISHSRANVEAGVGVQLNPGDSWRIESEAPVWVGGLPTATTLFYQAIETFDSPDGAIDF